MAVSWPLRSACISSDLPIPDRPLMLRIRELVELRALRYLSERDGVGSRRNEDERRTSVYAQGALSADCDAWVVQARKPALDVPSAHSLRRRSTVEWTSVTSLDVYAQGALSADRKASPAQARLPLLGEPHQGIGSTKQTA